MKANNDIRLLAAGKGVRLWQIAKALGVSETWFIRIMREELPEQKREQVIKIINDLAQEVN